MTHTGHLVGVLLEHLEHLLLPAHVKLLGQVLPLGRARMPHKAAVLCAEAELLNVAQVLREELLVAAGNDPDGVAMVGGKRLQAVDNTL